MRKAALLLLCSLLLAATSCRRDRLHCRKNCECPDLGLCTEKDNRCVATDDDDCRESRMCQQRGKCKAKGGACIADSQADCEASDWCRRLGHCTLKVEEGVQRCLK